MQARRHWRWKAALAAALLFFAAGSVLTWEFIQQPAGQGNYGAITLRNYGVVWPGKLTRSGVPYFDSGWEWLHGQGTRSIVTFLDEHDDHDVVDVDYRKFGFEHVLRIPLKWDRVPTDEQAEKFLEFIQNPNNWPVHLHCYAGKDRTGMMTALARYAIDGWPLSQALAEARRYRGGKELSAFRVEWLRKWAARHKPGSERRQVSSEVRNDFTP